MIKCPAGSRYVRNITSDLYHQSKPNVAVSRDLDLVQIEIIRCRKGQLWILWIHIPCHCLHVCKMHHEGAFWLKPFRISRIKFLHVIFTFLTM